MEKNLNSGNVLASACPSRQILQHLTSRWGALVLVSLHSGTKRFSELRRAIDGVSERMLTKTLQELEADGMLIRKSYNTVPPQVDYTLTEFWQKNRQLIRRIYYTMIPKVRLKILVFFPPHFFLPFLYPASCFQYNGTHFLHLNRQNIL